MPKAQDPTVKAFRQAVNGLFDRFGSEADIPVEPLDPRADAVALAEEIVGPARPFEIAVRNAGRVIVPASVTLGVFRKRNPSGRGFTEHQVHFDIFDRTRESCEVDYVSVTNDAVVARIRSGGEAIQRSLDSETVIKFAEWLGEAVVAPEAQGGAPFASE